MVKIERLTLAPFVDTIVMMDPEDPTFVTAMIFLSPKPTSSVRGRMIPEMGKASPDRMAVGIRILFWGCIAELDRLVAFFALPHRRTVGPF